jgi:hypothetical protein
MTVYNTREGRKRKKIVSPKNWLKEQCLYPDVKIFIIFSAFILRLHLFSEGRSTQAMKASKGSIYARLIFNYCSPTLHQYLLIIKDFKGSNSIENLPFKGTVS